MPALVKKKKILKNFKNIKANNEQFVSYIDNLLERSEEISLLEEDKSNLNVLKTHLNNMTFLFSELSNSVENKNKTGL